MKIPLVPFNAIALLSATGKNRRALRRGLTHTTTSHACPLLYVFPRQKREVCSLQKKTLRVEIVVGLRRGIMPSSGHHEPHLVHDPHCPFFAPSTCIAPDKLRLILCWLAPTRRDAPHRTQLRRIIVWRAYAPQTHKVLRGWNGLPHVKVFLRPLPYRIPNLTKPDGEGHKPVYDRVQFRRRGSHLPAHMQHQGVRHFDHEGRHPPVLGRLFRVGVGVVPEADPLFVQLHQ
mmetsp:Transcript_56533/g.77039  ORF Transcript_56533/g.77039 Transcript_56533/m.77039 type:complete len:231 (-) Transcript_56533:1652-2344(-)